MAAMQDIVMASTLPATATIGKIDTSTRLSPSVTSITINELAHSGSESPESSSSSSPAPGDHHHHYHNSTISQNATPAVMHNPLSTEKQAPRLHLNNTDASEPQTPDTTNDADDSTNKVVQMAVDELRAMGETLRRATKQQQRLIEETMSQWRQEQNQEQHPQHQHQHHHQYQQFQYQQQHNQPQQYYPRYQYRQSASPGYYGNGDHGSPAMSAGSATAVGSSQ